MMMMSLFCSRSAAINVCATIPVPKGSVRWDARIQIKTDVCQYENIDMKNRPADDDTTSQSVEFSFDYDSRVVVFVTWRRKLSPDRKSWEFLVCVRNQMLKRVSGSLSF